LANQGNVQKAGGAKGYMANFYNNIEVDIEACHEKIVHGCASKGALKYYLTPLRKILYRSGQYQKLIDAGMLRGWFAEFEEFWEHVLGGRPLRLHDFFFLYSHYRTRFQVVTVVDHAKPQAFMEAWQQYENIYSIFSAVYRYALYPFSYVPFKRFLKPGSSILEYGCGLAPIVTSMVRSRQKSYTYTIADIRSFTYAYAKYWLSPNGITCIDLDPGDLPEFREQYDVIFLLTVLEHLPEPLAVVQRLTRYLKPGGNFIFDYILGEGTGLDTQAGLEQRLAVLHFIRDNCEIVSGCLKEQASMGITVARRK